MNAANPPPDDSSSPPATSWLAREAKEGGSDGFGVLYSRIAPAIYAWACLRIRPSVRSLVDPEDLMQEVWVRAWRRFPDFDVSETPFRPWIFRIANNVLLEGFKRVRGRPLARGKEGTGTLRLVGLEAVPDEATSVSRRVARDEGVRRFVDRVTGLTQEEKRLLLFRGLEGLSHQVVAARLGLEVAVARKRWQRLRERLREQGLPEAVFEGD